jgi:hypothetical protein
MSAPKRAATRILTINVIDSPDNSGPIRSSLL